MEIPVIPDIFVSKMVLGIPGNGVQEYTRIGMTIVPYYFHLRELYRESQEK